MEESLQRKAKRETAAVRAMVETLRQLDTNKSKGLYLYEHLQKHPFLMLYVKNHYEELDCGLSGKVVAKVLRRLGMECDVCDTDATPRRATLRYYNETRDYYLGKLVNDEGMPVADITVLKSRAKDLHTILAGVKVERLEPAGFSSDKKQRSFTDV